MTEVESNADARRRVILDRAAELFSAAGHGNVSVEEVAAASGMRKPTLYHYFGSRDEIVAAMHDAIADDMLAHADALVAARTPPREAIRSIVFNVVVGIQEKPGYLRAFFDHYREISEPAFRDIAAKRARYAKIVQRFVEQGVEDGSFRSVDPRMTALAILGMCNWTCQWYRPETGPGPDEIADAFADVIVTGVGATAGLRHSHPTGR
jgi:AcrR family transcriptional regulator